ncbi:MAG: hypothetical protein QXM75_04085 [Candidatus Diapherotrites archaeon]
MRLKKILRPLLLGLLLLLISANCFSSLDSDLDLVPDEQEILDKTNPNDPGDNALTLKIYGEVVLGNTVTMAIEHPTLGKIKDIEFSIKSKTKTVNLNSANSGEVTYTIEEAGPHYISAKKNNFALYQQMVPACGYEQKEATILPFVVLFTANFTNLTIALILFLLFIMIMQAYLINSEDLAALFAGFLAFGVFYVNQSMLLPMLSTERLMVQIYLLVELVVGLFTIHLTKTDAMKRIAEKAAHAKKPSEGLFKGLISFKKKQANELERINMLKKDITIAKRGLSNAILEAKVATDSAEFQEKMEKISEHIERLQRNLQETKLMKENAIRKTSKTIEDIQAEKELDLMIEDISRILATELNITELPETIEPVKEKKTLFGILATKLKKPSKTELEKANVCISLSDTYGQALNASNAIFFVGNKEIKPIRTVAEKAYFYFSATVVELYVRYLGFIDQYQMIETSDVLEEIQIKMKHSLSLTITDVTGKELRDAFITITDESGKKVEDIYKNSIWKTPSPANASDGTAAIALNPTQIKGNILKINIVRAGFKSKEIIIPASKISTEEQQSKVIMLEKG